MVCDLQLSLLVSNLLSLNPYSIGIWSATYYFEVVRVDGSCLNPYSIGIWSATEQFKAQENVKVVLILILLEYGLRQTLQVPAQRALIVLILILLEYGLRREKESANRKTVLVLILILLEYGLRPINENVNKSVNKS